MSEGVRVRGVWRDDSQIYDAPNPLVVPPPPEAFRINLSGWLGLGALAILAPAFFPAFVRPSEVPQSIRALYDPKELTIVEFFDFQCPHCRDLSPRLKEIAEDFAPAKIRYGYTPLPSHPDSRDAARISICAGEQKKEAEVTAAFFQTDDLKRGNALKIALALVPNEGALRACLGSERPDARIEQDVSAIKEAGFVGLPTTYIGGTRILGAESDAVYRDALRRAREGQDAGGISRWLYWLGILAVGAAIVLLARREPRDRTTLHG
jgi:predicted DsbA family dithiol-disulfide isomerase